MVDCRSAVRHAVRFAAAIAMAMAAVAPVCSGGSAPAEGKSTIIVRVPDGKERISRNIYGQFAEHLGHCIYGGLWVGEDSPIPNTRGIRNDVVAALRKIRVPVLRWPGGCFADEYHWRDGIGPRDMRPTMVNTHWGKVTENNHFGTHEFFDLCEQLGCEPYICGNLGSGTVREMQEWVEYITFDGISPMADLRRANGRDEPWKIKYWGVGNENWGCGGNMRAEFYADQYRRYATYLRDLGGNRLQRIACGAYGDRFDWTEVLMREAGSRMQGLALHYYCGSGKTRKHATEFDDEDWYAQLHRALRIDDLLTRHAAVMDRFDPRRRVAMIVDEWGAWHEVEEGTNPGFLYQQNTLHDALVAGVTLNIFNNHCERVKMANIAQMVNVLQAMVLTDGPQMMVTPTYHVFEMYTVHHDATMLPVDIDTPRCGAGTDEIPALNVSASRDGSGKIHLSICNLDLGSSHELRCEFQGFEAQRVSGRVLTADDDNAHNTFDEPRSVEPVAFDGAATEAGAVQALIPARSVVVLEVE